MRVPDGFPALWCNDACMPPATEDLLAGARRLCLALPEVAEGGLAPCPHRAIDDSGRRITAIRFNFDTAGFTIVDYRDIPGRNIVALIDDDQPCLAERAIRHVAEPILLLAHEDRERCSRPTCRSTTGETTPIYDPETSPTRRSRRIAIDKGDVDDGFAAADVVVEGEYRTGHQEQLYIEPNGVVAVPDARCGGITVYGSMQCPYYVHRALTVLLGLPDDKVRVDPDRNRRRLRRQGRVSVDDRRPRGAARAQGAAGR